MDNYRFYTEKNIQKHTQYDYNKAVYEDLIDFCKENYVKSDFDSVEDAVEKIQQDAFISDVTGNGIGSYWCNCYKAQYCLVGNYGLEQEAAEEYGSIDRTDPEARDVEIRCYILSQVAEDAITYWFTKK